LYLEVNFDGTSSSDANDDTLTYAWDLDGDGAYDDSTSPSPTYTYQESGSYTARLRVSDPNGASDTDSVVIDVCSAPPVATIDTPLPATTWKVGDVIDFSGSATDEQDGTVPASPLSWDLIMHH
jgi:PKD repeat protein